MAAQDSGVRGAPTAAGVATAGAGRYDAAGAMIDGKLVVFGGNAGSTGFKKDLQSMSAVDMGL